MNLSTGYTPRNAQVELHLNKSRFNVWVLHRRFGKTIACVNEIVDSALQNKLHNPQYAYIGPNYSQTKRIAWEYVKQFTRMIPGVEYNESELKVTIPRPLTKDGRYGDKITIYLLGAENPDSIRGIYLDGCVLDEYAVMHPKMWSEIVRPALMDRTGWAIFAGTPKGMNQFYDILQVAKRNTSGDWYWKIARASETGILNAQDLIAAKEEMGDAVYAQEMECDFGAALVGAYYGKEMSQAELDKRITTIPYEPAVLVETAWDLGISDTTVIWFFQQVGREIRVIDFVEDAGHGLSHYAEVLKKRGYKYGEHFFPHDVAARDLSTGKSRQETLRSLGINPIRMVPKMRVEDRIQATRQLIPKVWFDGKKCERGIHALKSYERKWDDKNQIFLSSPLHNWASHAADAFGCYALGFKDEGQKSRMSHLPRQTESDYDIFSR